MAQYHSRLQKKQQTQNIRRAFFFVVLTIALGLAMVFFGIPVLIRLAVFIGDLRGAGLPIEPNDVLAPPSPRLNALAEATNSNQVDLQGFTEAGTTVEIFLDEALVEKIIAEADGSFLISHFQLSRGENQIYAVAVDQAGNQSQPSTILIVFFDDEPPNLEILEPSGENLITSEGKFEIKGKTEPEVGLEINERFVIVNAEGNFGYLVWLNEGENAIKLVATDKAGNQTTKEIIIKRE